MNKPNAELAYRVLDQIDAHPEQWDQGSWVSNCGTSFCFAGWAIVLTGHTFLDYLDPADGFRRMGLDNQEAFSGDVMDTARRELGIASVRGICDLFAPENTREDLDQLVAKIFGPRPVSEDPA